jgi:signal peptidase I
MLECKKSVYRENIESFAIAVLVILFINIFVLQSFLVKGPSMQPTLHEDERLFVSKFIYQLRLPKTGDIVVIIPPGDPTRKYIKRVIAGPGQTVTVDDSKVYVDGQVLFEPYIKEKTLQNYSMVVVPQETIFVMGDNRNCSKDSRDPAVGFVPLKNVVGKAVFIFWPVPNIAILRNPKYDPKTVNTILPGHAQGKRRIQPWEALSC